jgi:hypothetical protein
MLCSFLCTVPIPWVVFHYDHNNQTNKLIAAKLIKKFPDFMQPEGSLPYSHKPATGHNPESDESSLHRPKTFL